MTKAQAKELTPFQRNLAIITLVGLTIYSVANVALVITAYLSLHNNITELGDIINNWQAGAVQDIVVAPNCPNGYESVANRGWPGIDEGCWCGNSSAATLKARNITCDPFCKGSCSSTALNSKCVNVPSQPGQGLNYLGFISATNTKNQICIKRSSESWATAASLSEDGTCPDGYKLCQKTKENLFCTKEAKCPITSITIKNISLSEVAACTTSANCSILTNDGISEIQSVTWTRETVDRLPLVEFKLDEFGICKLKSEDNVTPGRRQFSLLGHKPTSCRNEGGSRWIESNTIREDRLFDVNGLTSGIASLEKYTTSSMAGYYATSESGKNFFWNLYSRNYIPWKPSCRNRMESFIEKKSFVDDMKRSQLALMVIGCIATCLFGFPLAVMEFMNLRGYDLPCISGKGEEERTKLKRFRKFMTYGFKGVQLPFQIWAIVVTGGARGLLSSVSEEECSNDDTNVLLAYIAKTMNKTFTNTLTALAMLVATLILDIILEIWQKNKAKKEQAAQKTVHPMSKLDKLDLQNLDHDRSISPLQFDPNMSLQAQPQMPANIVVQIDLNQSMGPGYAGYPGYPQQQYPIQQQPYPQYPPRQYVPQQGYPPQQPMPQGYPPQQQQYAQQQYPPNQGYPYQQYPAQQYPPK